MSQRTVRISLSAFVIIGALSMLMYTTVSEGAEYYKHVDEVMVSPADWYGKRMHLHGFVVDGSRTKRDKTLEYRFDVQNQGQVVSAYYKGIVPDNFKDGAEVVLKGTLGPDGFTADEMLAKCPSKYEEMKKLPGR